MFQVHSQRFQFPSSETTCCWRAVWEASGVTHLFVLFVEFPMPRKSISSRRQIAAGGTVPCVAGSSIIGSMASVLDPAASAEDPRRDSCNGCNESSSLRSHHCSIGGTRWRIATIQMCSRRYAGSGSCGGEASHRLFSVY